MKKKSFYLLILCAFFALTVFSIGGCGGSSSSNFAGNNDNGNNDNPNPYNPSNVMVSAVNDVATESSDISKFINEFVLITGLNGGSEDEYGNSPKDDPLAVLADMVSKDNVLFFDYSNFVSNDKFNNAENVIKAFNRGAVIAMVYPTQEHVNFLLNQLGLEPTNIIPEDSNDPHDELLAVRNTDNGPSFYLMPCISNFNVSVDISETSEVNQDEYDDFQRDRIRSFINWVESDDFEVSSEFRVADEIVYLNELSTPKKITVDFSYQDKAQSEHGIKTFSHKVAYTIYSCHTFEDKKDYFVVEMDSQANPKKQIKHEVINTDSKIYNRTIKCQKDSLAGYMMSLDFENEIDVDSFIREAQPISDRTGEIDVSYNFGGCVGYDVKTIWGATFNPNNVAYKNNFYVNSDDFTLKNEDTNWNIGFYSPQNGETVVGKTGADSYQKVEPSATSIKTHRDKMVYIYEVDRSDIAANNNKVVLTTKVTSKHGYTEGNAYGGNEGRSFAVPRVDSVWYTTEKTFQTELVLPPTVSSAKIIQLDNRSAVSRNFQMLSDEDWTMDTQADWVRVSKVMPGGIYEPSVPARTISGKATGSNVLNVLIQIDENNTSQPRATEVLIKSQNGEVAKLAVQQSSL